MMKTRVLAVVLGASVGLGGLALAQPKRNVSAERHPHIAKAQQLARQAWQQVSDAQQANEWDGMRRKPRNCSIKSITS
jgi:hypothetical protein